MKKSAIKLLPLLAGVALAGSAEAKNLRIIGGDKVNVSQYPYMAALVNRGVSAEQAFCGASVISDRWILTAAHCLKGETANNLDVLTGITALSKASVGERIKATRIIMHPQYDDDLLINDIALIELSSPTSAPPVRMASKSDSAIFAAGKAVSVAGWGNLSTTGENYPDVLHAVDLSVSDFASCSTTYGGLLPTHLCASVPGGKKDSCQGDSGGPLVAKTQKGAVQIGVVSYGDACASPTHPGVYTNVSEFADFIKRTGINTADNQANNGVVVEVPTVDPVQATQPSQPQPVEPETQPTSPVVSEPTDNVNPAASFADVEASIVESFSHVAEFETSWSYAEIYNGGEATITVSNLQLPDAVSFDSYEDDCFAYELQPGEVCYIDLSWTPTNGNNLNGALKVDLFNGVANQTVSLPLTAKIVESVDVGNDIDWPEADYYSGYADEWDYDDSDYTNGGSAISSNMENTDTLDLMSVFDEEHDYDLQFEYQLDGVNCFIYLDDELAYELAAHDEWQLAELSVNAGAEVRWEFKSVNRDRGQRKVRLDALKVSSVKSSESTSQAPNTSADALNTSVNFVDDGGAGSEGQFGVLSLLALAAIRRRVSVSAKRA